MSLQTKSQVLIFLILTLVTLAGCRGGGKATAPDYSATGTASARYYQTQAAESLARATSSAADTPHTDAGTFPAAPCVIAAAVVGGIIFLFAQSRRRNRRK